MSRGAIVRAVAAGALLAAASVTTHAQSLAVMPDDTVAVAHDGRVELFAPSSHKSVATFAGVAHAGDIAVTRTQIAVADPLGNEVVVIDRTAQRARRFSTGETPVALAFAGADLYVLCRDARTLERFTPGGERQAVTVGAGASLLRFSNGKLYVYAAADGLLQEITPSPFAVARQVRIAPFASDLETDAKNALLTYPAEGLVRFVSLERFAAEGQSRVGAVPVDVATVSKGTALTARTMAIADPASKRVWMVEGRQSVWEAFLRGFLRGVIGLGLFGGRDSAFPTGVDRVLARGRAWLAYDSSSGTLYRFSKSRASVVAREVPPRAFALASDGVVFWQSGTLVAQNLD